MAFRSTLAAVGALTALASVVACSSGTPVGANAAGLQTQLSNDVAANTGQAVVSDIAETGNDAGGSGSYAVQLPRGVSASIAFGMGGANCTESGGAGDLRYYCTPDTLTITNSAPFVADTLIRTWNYEFYKRGDTAQAQFDTLTDSINFGGANGVLVYAAAHRSRWHGVSHRVRNHSVTDHPSFTKDVNKQSTWNGNTVANDTASYTGTVWSVDYTGVAYDSTVSVVFQRPRASYPYPLSGQFHRWATWNYSASGPSILSGQVSRHIVVTYNGSSIAQLQVIGSTVLTCSLDLSTGEVSNCH